MVRRNRRNGGDTAGGLARASASRPAGDVQVAFQIGLGKKMEIPIRVLDKPFGEKDAGVADHTVDGTEPVDRRRGTRPRGGCVADVSIQQRQIARRDELRF